MSDDVKVSTFAKTDSISQAKRLAQYVSRLKKEGYVYTTIDTSFRKSDTLCHFIYTGKKFKFNPVIDDSISRQLVDWLGINLKSSYDMRQKEELEKKMLQKFSKNGYPFAKIEFDSLTTRGDTIAYILTLNSFDFIIFDTLKVYPDNVISKKFLYRYLDIEPSSPYNHEKVLNSKKNLQNLAYLKLKRDPSVSFINKKAIVNLAFEKVKANRFDFIIGLLPNTENGVRKWLVTGDVTAEFQNLLNVGEYSYFNFKRLKPENQELSVKFSMPYIFDLPVGPDVDFKLLKNSDTNLDLTSRIGFRYHLKGLNQLSVYWDVFNSSLINIDSTSILASKKLPSNLDVNYNGGGAKIDLYAIDYLYNPTQGWTININSSIGSRRILENYQISSLKNEFINFESAYDTIPKNNLQFTSSIDGSYYLKSGTVGTVRLGLYGIYKFSNSNFLLNELYRYGGNRNLKGFDEEAFRVDRAILLDIEYRFILNKDSYLSLPFFQYSKFRSLADNIFSTHQAMSIGLGISFSTPAGLFNVSFAAGKLDDSAFDFNNAKIHFGYLNRF
ncbi:MAG TPA: hypothetical protein PK246_02375 [Saprospiraceae bacterium]|nr:hypothetical protein [Lewinellaceae bacterium]HPK09155.1 hypothetical protein [Saprospiraceae bacterium]